MGILVLENTSIDMGEIAYNGYLESSGGKSLVSGAQLPVYAQLSPEIQKAWRAAASALANQLHLTALPSPGGWVGVDFDGTMCHYGTMQMGEPIMPVVNYVRRLLAKGVEVRVVTARVAPVQLDGVMRDTSRDRKLIEDWCEKHVGQKLAVTHMKDYGMLEIVDDRAIQVVCNTGQRADAGDWT